ncbi:MAG: permease [Deltaproteobacteria bacterium]|nr:permease [Deltaproteobacteria bacterium]
MNTNSVVAIFNNHEQAAAAVRELNSAGFDMTKLSIVGKDLRSEEHVTGYYNAGDRMKYWGKMGAFWGALWGVLLGGAVFWVPGIGQLVVGGPLVAWIVGALEGAAVAGGLSALGAGLYSIGIPRNSVLRYERELRHEHYLVLAQGTATEIAHAQSVLTACSTHDVELHASA